MITLLSKPFKIFLLIAVLLAAGEITYRNSWINFNSGVFEKLNPGQGSGSGKSAPVVLVLGDEISANTQSYVAELRKRFPGYTIVNGAVPYTGPVETSWRGEKLIAEYDPDVLIYQMNPANDLYNIRKGNDLDEAGFFSAITDMMSDKMKIFDYISGSLRSVYDNMSGSQLAMVEPEGVPVSQQFEFATNVTVSHESQKGLIENSTMLKGGRDADLGDAIEMMDNLFCKVKKDCRVLLTVVPHSSWINGWYRERMTRNGNYISEAFTKFNGEMPFMKKIKDHIFANNRVRVIDPTTQLRNSDSKDKRMYNISSDLLNQRGHEVLAGVLSGYIRYAY